MPKPLLLAVAAVPVLVAASPALADVCAWNTAEVAQRAAAMVKPGDTVQWFCGACGDSTSKPTSVKTVAASPVASNPSYHEFLVNGGGMDLAYTYVRTAPDKPWTNLGSLVQCSPDNDSPKELQASQVSAQAAQ